MQLTGAPTILNSIDVDTESIGTLEAEMFEHSSRTGASGNEQWGLDVGHHCKGTQLSPTISGIFPNHDSEHIPSL